MATYQDLTLPVRLFMKGYPFARYAVEPRLRASLRRPLGESRVALVTSAGLHTPEHPGFDFSNKRGDTSFREIPNDINTQTLIESHRSGSFDHAGIEADKNLGLPLDRFHELEARGRVGQLNHRHFSFMGSIVGPRPLIDESAPQVARMLRDDGVEAVLLTPV